MATNLFPVDHVRTISWKTFEESMKNCCNYKKVDSVITDLNTVVNFWHLFKPSSNVFLYWWICIDFRIYIVETLLANYANEWVNVKLTVGIYHQHSKTRTYYNVMNLKPDLNLQTELELKGNYKVTVHSQTCHSIYILSSRSSCGLMFLYAEKQQRPI